MELSKPLLASILILAGFARSLPAQKPTARPALGTAQLAGDNGKLGQPYTLGQSERLNIVLTGVRYAKARWNHGEGMVAPNVAQKLLILSYGVQNPNRVATPYVAYALTFTAIDSEGVNHEGVAAVRGKNDARDVNVELKPAQRIDCESVVVVPANGTIPKLMVASRTGGAVLRYDLRGYVAPLPKPASDDGHDALATIEGKPDLDYPLLGSDVRYASTAFQAHQVGDVECADEQMFMLAKMTFAVRAPSKSSLVFRGEAVDEDGERYPSVNMRKASTEGPMGDSGDAGQELTGRMLFKVPKGVKIVKLRVWEGEGDERSSAIEYPVGQYATPDGQPPKKGTPGALGRKERV